jgi:predicted transport protein
MLINIYDFKKNIKKRVRKMRVTSEIADIYIEIIAIMGKIKKESAGYKMSIEDAQLYNRLGTLRAKLQNILDIDFKLEQEYEKKYRALKREYKENLAKIEPKQSEKKDHTDLAKAILKTNEEHKKADKRVEVLIQKQTELPEKHADEIKFWKFRCYSIMNQIEDSVKNIEHLTHLIKNFKETNDEIIIKSAFVKE